MILDVIKNRKTFFALEDRFFVQVLQRILETVCLSVPNLYNYKGLPVWYILYTVLFIIFLNGAFIYQINNRFHTYFQTIPKTAAALEGISFTGMTLTNTLSIVLAIFSRRKHVVKLVKQLKEAENIFHETFGAVDKKENKFILMFLVTHFCFLLYFIMDCTVYISAFGLGGVSNYFMTYFNIYMLCLSVLQICSHALSIKYTLRNIYEKMQDIIGTGIKDFANDQSNRESVENLRIFMKIFDRICDAIETINECFGIQIVLIVCNSVAFIIIGLNLCFKIILKRVEFSEKTPYMIFVSVWCSFLFVVSFIMCVFFVV